MNVQLMTKEQLGNCQFSVVEVLRGDWEKVYRLYSLQRAERLGKLHSSRVRISFHTQSNEIRMVKAVVNSVNDSFVLLSGGYSIPLKAVLTVEF